MADIVVPIVLENLIKLGTYEANMLLGVEDQVHILKGDLRFINAFLQKSAGKRKDPLVKVLVDQISEAALDSEDVIDAYAAQVARERRRNLLGKLFHFFGRARVLHGVANQTTSIKNEINNIYNNRTIFGVGEGDGPSVDDEEAEQSIERRRNVEEDDVVGFVNDTTTLINQLTDQGNLRRDVISIHGMGGLGKTTLARKIYNNSRIKNHFDFCAWVSVSQQWQTKRLLLELLKIRETSERLAEDLKEELHEKLKGKRYLIVMDDVWSTQVWEELRGAFPDESNGSRILITTRVRDVAWHASPTPPHELPFLDENESWELLQKKVFRGREWESLPNLEEPGRELAKSCRGLPLSIVLLGGILATKEKSHRVWARFIGNVNSYLSEGVSIQTLSYNHLPLELKPCFLYLGMFPEDTEIRVRHLIELWIAEGFIQSDRNTSIYDVAEDYLEKLIDRSMIQVASKRLDGGVKTCRIHDLLRDLCIAESRRDKFFDIYSIDNKFSLNRKSRRLSVQLHMSTVSLTFDLSASSSCARSLLFFGGRFDYNPISESLWKQIYKSTQFIRVLYLFGLKIKKIPSQIEELILLRCLFIKKCKVEYVSSSIWNFQYLETLHLELWKGSDTSFMCIADRSLPRGIWSVMKNLRYLYLADSLWYNFGNIKPPRSLKGEISFWNLQVLHWLQVNQNTALVIAKFPKLRKLGLIFEKENEVNEVEKVMASIGRLESLQSFKIRCWTSNYNKVVTRLNLLPSTLTNISWESYGTFDRDIFEGLARQPHLRVLKLTRNVLQHLPVEVSVVAGDFPQLEVLKLIFLPIKTWEMEKDAMPNLQSLFLVECSDLEYLPEDELLCRPNLQLVQASGQYVPDKLKTFLTDFKIKYPATPYALHSTKHNDYKCLVLSQFESDEAQVKCINKVKESEITLEGMLAPILFDNGIGSHGYISRISLEPRGDFTKQ